MPPQETSSAAVDPAEAANSDLITGTPGSHPVGTGLGAATGGAAGAALGTMAGPAGALIGAAVGAIAGGLVGKGGAELANPTDEDAYWRNAHRDQPDYDPALDYERDYAPAYRVGWRLRVERPGAATFSESEFDYQNEWEKTKGESRLSYRRALDASRAAWERGGSLKTPTV